MKQAAVLLGCLSACALCGQGRGQDSARAMAEQIVQLESQVAADPDGFDWKVHNELRHLYGQLGDHRRSRRHADVICKNSFMDDYMLHIFSGWQLDKDRAAAIKALQENADAASDCPSLAAACRIKAGDLLIAEGDADAAAALYKVAADPSAAALYRKAAKVRLGLLALAPLPPVQPLAVVDAAAGRFGK